MKVIQSNSIIEYSDFRKFVNFIDNRPNISLKNINPFEYFRPSMSSLSADEDLKVFSKSLFNTRSVKIPNFRIPINSFNHFTRFEDFTSTDEVRNLSLWALSCLKNLSYEKQVRLGKELEIIQSNNPRDGRLDVVALCEEQLLIFEVKVSLTSLLREGRYKYQIPAYIKESSEIIKRHNCENGKNKKINVILLVGGEEGDIYPPSHPDCTTGQVGNISKIFYDSIQEYNIRFMTANSLWSLAAYSELFNTKVYWNNLIFKVFSKDNNIGFLSGGIVTINNGVIEVVPIDLSSYI